MNLLRTQHLTVAPKERVCYPDKIYNTRLKDSPNDSNN